MTDYQHHWDFERDTARLIAEGATLRDLYDAMLSVHDFDAQSVNASPRQLHLMSQNWWQSPAFVPIRLSELFGDLEVPHTDDYILAMIGHLGGRHEQEVRLHLLRHDSELRDDIFWRIFEVEGGGQISLTNIDKFSREDLNWHNTVIQLAEEGTIDRAQLLHACLAALNRDFSAYRAGWFSQVYNSLAPSAAEAAADQGLLRQCLASSATATVSVGARYLAAIHKAGLLDAPEFVAACAPALSGPKVAALGILRMLAKLAADEAASTDAIVDAATYALAHPHVDVQRAAVALLIKLGRDDIARASRDALAPAVAAELLPEAAPLPQVDEVAGRDVTSRAVEAGEPVHPWSDDDAHERFSALLEFGTSAIELELALAWLAITENASATLAPLVKRARKIQSDDGRFWIAALVQVAVDPETPYLPQMAWQHRETVIVDGEQVVQAVGEPTLLDTEEEKTVLPSLVTRLREVASIVRGRAPRRRLLATPTDTHGWIDPDVLLERLDDGYPPLPVDLTQAILRVQPTDRDRVAAAFGAPAPSITETITIEWRSKGSTTLKASGSPEWVSWKPEIVADVATAPSPTEPALIPSSDEATLWKFSRRETSALVAASLGLVDPASSLPLVAVAVPVMQFVMSEVNHSAGPLLEALASHSGPWTSETTQVVALGMASQQAELRTQATELFAAAIPMRISAAEAAVGFASCQPVVALNRWTTSFSDAATLAPIAVIDLLTHLLPELSRDTRGIGALMGVLIDECLRHHRAATDPELRAWLGSFAGTSGAAKVAKALLEL
jgi:hypothetical protein